MKKILLQLSVICISMFCQGQIIPNGNFESWTNSEPLFWSTNNYVINYLGGLPIQGESPAPEGDSCISVNVRLNTILPIAVPGIASTIFATSSRPLSFEGFVKHSALSQTDSTIARVIFSKWDEATMTQMTIGQGLYRSIGGTNDWTNFAVPITYYSNLNPDSCTVFLTTFGQANSSGSFDNLRLTMTNSVKEQSAQDFDWMLYPNPTNESLTLYLDALGFLGETQLEIFSTEGKLVHSEKIINKMNPTLNISHLNNGQYELALRNGNRRLVKTFVKN